jgi:hypothetical protein
VVQASHSIVQSDRSTLICKEKSATSTVKMPIAGLSKILALESTEKFPRFRASMASATIDSDRSIFCYIDQIALRTLA